MWGRGDVRSIGLVVLVALGACSSQMDPSAGMMSGTTPASTSDSLSDLASISAPPSLMVLGSNGGVLTGTKDSTPHYFKQDPGAVAAAAFAAHISICPVELDELVMPPAPSSDVVASLEAELSECDLAVGPFALTELRQLQTPTTVVIVGANATETWHTTNNGVNYFYGNDVLYMLRAARVLNVSACVVAPADIALPMAPSGQTPGVSIADALAGCGLPP
jgi:hypothetical protein